MYYFPAGEKFLLRHPFLTVMLCVVIGGAFAWYGYIQYCELRGFGTSPAPLAVERASVVLGDFAPGRWVELQGELRFDCASTAVVRGTTMESYFFGHAADTYVPATDLRQEHLFVFMINRAAFCGDVMRRPWRGVLRSASKYDLDRVRRYGFVVPRTLTQPPMLLETFGGPGETRKMLILSVLAAALMVMGAALFWRKYRIAEAKRESGWAQYAGKS